MCYYIRNGREDIHFMRMGKAKIQYHPAFASGIELLMWEYQASLVIET